MAQVVKRLSAMLETRVWSLGREDPQEKEMATHSSTLAWKIAWTEEPGRLQSMGSQRVGHDWATLLYLSFPLTSVFMVCLFHLFTFIYSYLRVPTKSLWGLSGFPLLKANYLNWTKTKQNKNRLSIFPTFYPPQPSSFVISFKATNFPLSNALVCFPHINHIFNFIYI